MLITQKNPSCLGGLSLTRSFKVYISTGSLHLVPAQLVS
jgi:hypothetical protein